MTQDEKATLANILKDHGFTHEEARAAMADLYERIPGPSRGWISRLLANLRSGRYVEDETPEVKQRAEAILGGNGATNTTPPVEPTDTKVYAEWLPESNSPKRHRQPAKRVLMRAAVYDVECTDFNSEGYAGYLICCCILPLDRDDVQTLAIRFEEHGDDRRLVREVAAALNEYDILIGHNIQAFDANFLNSRLMFHGYPVLNTSLVFDTFQVAKALSIKTRKGLGNLMDYFGLDGTKTTIFRTSWNNVRSPYVDEFNEAMTEIQYHCGQDVFGNRALFDVLYGYALSMKTNPFKISKMISTSWGIDNLEDVA